MFYIPGKPCPSLTISNSNVTSINTGVYEDVVYVDCQQGYSVPGRCTPDEDPDVGMHCELSYVTECLSSGTWSREDNCKSRPLSTFIFCIM